VDGGGSMRCALLGDMLATLAVENGWTGLVINGCIRDSAVIATIDIGVKAIAAHPRKSVKRGIVGVNDIFPEEFPDFLITDPVQRQLLKQLHPNLFQAEYWSTLQSFVAADRYPD